MINAIETGKCDPSLPLAFEIARVFGKTAEEVSLKQERELRSTPALMPADVQIGPSIHEDAIFVDRDPAVAALHCLVNREKHSGINGPSRQTPSPSLPGRNGVPRRV